MAIAVAAPANPYGWLRSGPFDLTLIVGAAALAIATGLTAVARPDWFTIILFLDLWLLGYHHVIATFTRLTLDSESFRDHRFLVLGLPWVVLAGTLMLGMVFGFWAIATLYLYWQFFHYTRQSYGIIRIFGRKAGEAVARDAKLTNWALYLTPLWGILYRSYQAQEKFLGMEVAYLPTHLYVVYAAGAAAAGTFLYWTFRQVRALQEGRFVPAMALYMLSHFAIFVVGYLAIEDISHGWLVLNVWHNAQYILIVWMYNANRFKGGVNPRAKLLSSLSQTRILNIFAYFGFCLFATTVVYGCIRTILKLDLFAAIPLATIVTYQTINFHHYIVDGLIWKVRKKKLRETLGIAT